MSNPRSRLPHGKVDRDMVCDPTQLGGQGQRVGEHEHGVAGRSSRCPAKVRGDEVDADDATVGLLPGQVPDETAVAGAEIDDGVAKCRCPGGDIRRVQVMDVFPLDGLHGPLPFFHVRAFRLNRKNGRGRAGTATPGGGDARSAAIEVVGGWGLTRTGGKPEMARAVPWLSAAWTVCGRCLAWRAAAVGHLAIPS